MSTSVFALNSYELGDTNYLAKLNSNTSAIVAAVQGLQAFTQTGLAGSSTSVVLFFAAIFGTTTVCRLTDTSFIGTIGSLANFLNLTPGTLWLPDLLSIVNSPAVSLNFSAVVAGAGPLAPGTYWISVGQIGVVTISPVQTIDSIYSVSWSGTALSNLIPLGNILDDLLIPFTGGSTLVPPGTPVAAVVNHPINGLINGTNDTFTIPDSPAQDSVILMVNGVGQRPGIDFTLVGSTLTMTVPPQSIPKLDWMAIWY